MTCTKRGTSRITSIATALLALSIAHCQESSSSEADEIDYGNHNLEWEDGPASWEEFGHNNDPTVCGLPVLTVEEWEAGKHWDKNKPVFVKNVTDGWAALNHWKKQEMIRRYPNADATMGDGRRVGERGPDGAGNLLSPTTVKEFITKHMYNPFKYFFDRKIAIPKGMLDDCHPFPMPTRAFLKDPEAGGIHALSKKKKVNPKPLPEMWQDHLAISIGADLQGLSFHFHGEAWNTVIFGKKRWILYDHARWEHNTTKQRYMALAGPDEDILSSPEWLRQLYNDPVRKSEIRAHGHDCIQHAGELMFVPRNWMHSVINIGDTVSVISEVGLEKGEGKKPEDFDFDPHEESSDDSEDWSSDDSEDEDHEHERTAYRRRPESGYWSSDDDGDDDESED